MRYRVHYRDVLGHTQRLSHILEQFGCSSPQLSSVAENTLEVLAAALQRSFANIYRGDEDPNYRRDDDLLLHQYDQTRSGVTVHLESINIDHKPGSVISQTPVVSRHRFIKDNGLFFGLRRFILC